MSHVPQVDDYVVWKNGIEGWVYFHGKQYVTIEIAVRPKSQESFIHSSIHRNERVLVICYQNQWKELTFVKTRKQ